MSHIVKCKVEMKDAGCLDRAIKHLGLQTLGTGTHELFNGQKATGLAVKLPGWKYAAVIDTVKGELVYDNYKGSWGEQKELDALVQRYAVETAIDQAVAGGYTYEETKLANGDVELMMTALATS